MNSPKPQDFRCVENLPPSWTQNIRGNVQVKAQIHWAYVLASGKCQVVKFDCTDEYADIELVRHDPHWTTPFKLKWTLKDASKRGLDRNPIWKKYPRNMLQWRCLSDLMKQGFADILAFNNLPTHTIEEMAEDTSNLGHIDQDAFVTYEVAHSEGSTPPPPVPPPQKKTSENVEPQRQSSTPPPVPSAPPTPAQPPSKKFSRSAAQTPESLLSMLTDQGLSNVKAANNYKHIQTLYTHMIKTKSARLKFARLCLESDAHFDLAMHLQSFSLTLDDAAHWPKLLKKHDELAQGLADKYNNVDDPWTHYGRIFHDIGVEDIDIHAITQL